MLTEMLEKHQFLESPGYCSGKDLKGGPSILAKAGYKMMTWGEFLAG